MNAKDSSQEPNSAPEQEVEAKLTAKGPAKKSAAGKTSKDKKASSASSAGKGAKTSKASGAKAGKATKGAATKATTTKATKAGKSAKTLEATSENSQPDSELIEVNEVNEVATDVADGSDGNDGESPTPPSPASNDWRYVLQVAVIVSLVCSVLVASTAVLLRDLQYANAFYEQQQRILSSMGILPKNADGQVAPKAKVLEVFEQEVTLHIANLDDGCLDDGDPLLVDVLADLRSDEFSTELPFDSDLAGIRRRENRSVIYTLGPLDAFEAVTLPIRGLGLWSTLWGYLALEADLHTIRGIEFYEHGETPGLGGEVDNPRWKRIWEGKMLKALGEKEIRLEVLKGNVPPGSPHANYQIDGLSGATLTSKGVSNAIRFWLGENGYGPVLECLEILKNGGTCGGVGSNCRAPKLTNSDVRLNLTTRLNGGRS